MEVENEEDNLEDDSDRSFKFNKNSRRILNQFKNSNENIMNIKEAITDLYLAIKIRSCEELDRINENNLKEEKFKIM